MALTVVVAAGALATSIAQFVDSIPDIRANLPTIVAPWQHWLTSIGLGQIDLAGQATIALSNLDQIAGAAGRTAAAVRGGQPRRGRDDADRLLPVDLHGRRPGPDRGLPVPPGTADLCRRGPAAPDVGVTLVRRLPARPGAHGPRLLPDRARHEPAARTAARRALVGQRGHPPGDSLLRAVRVVGAAGDRGPRPAAERTAARRSC